MPTYQYACTNADCGNQFELVQSFTDPAASECPVCAAPVRKVYGSVGVVFKGSGFYRTDSRADNKKPASTASVTKDSASSSSSESSPSSSSSTTSSSTPNGSSTSSSSTGATPSTSKSAAPA